MAAEEVMEQEEKSVDKKAEKKAARAKKKEEKEAKKKAKDEENTEEESGGSRIAVVAVTIAFIAVWLGILVLVIKTDIGGFGSTVLQPILKDVPYVNKILPDTAEEETVDAQYPYTTLDEAIARIKELEVQLADAQSQTNASSDNVEQLQAEVARLKEFEEQQAAFEEEKTKFYKEVVFADNAPDISEYRAYYESIDPANAEILYKQVVEQEEADVKIQEYADTYAQMKPKQAAAIMEQMTDNLDLVAKILQNMDTSARGAILGAMDSEVAARITKIMEP